MTLLLTLDGKDLDCLIPSLVIKLLLAVAWWPWTWPCSPGMDGSRRMDSGMDSLRHEQVRLLCLRRHAAAAPRHSSASETRVSVLARCSDDCRLLGACWWPPTSTRRGDSTAGIAGRSTWRLLLLWLVLVTSTHS